MFHKAVDILMYHRLVHKIFSIVSYVAYQTGK